MQLDLNEISRIIKTSLAEDIGKGDITSDLTIPEDENTEMVFTTREDIIVCGLPILDILFKEFEGKINSNELVKDGDRISAGSEILKVSGNARAILASERLALNLLQHMSGIATNSAKYVKAVEGTNVKILDTRKTKPGLREIEKYAVNIGGATNHRIRLDDGILIKDNHISIAGGMEEICKKLPEIREKSDLKIEIECDTLEQVKQALSAKADIILLDNMSISQLSEAVKMVNGQALLEASGGITLNNIREIAETGVDFISVGALTHSAPAVDIGLDIT